MNPTIINIPDPPSLTDCYRAGIPGGLTAVFTEYDRRVKAWSAQVKIAQSSGGAPIHPGRGVQALTTPRQRLASGASTASSERLGWTRVSGLEKASRLSLVTTFGSGLWPISVGQVDSGRYGSISTVDTLVEVQYSVPPVDTPYVDVQGVRSYNTTGWPVPAAWKSRQSDILFPVLRVTLVPQNAPLHGGVDSSNLVQKVVFQRSPIPRATPPPIPEGSIAAGSIEHVSCVTWLEDTLGRPVKLTHAFAELV